MQYTPYAGKTMGIASAWQKKWIFFYDHAYLWSMEEAMVEDSDVLTKMPDQSPWTRYADSTSHISGFS